MRSQQTELALCLHSPVGLESLAGLEIPRGRSKGQFAMPPPLSCLAAQVESDRVMLLLAMGPCLPLCPRWPATEALGTRW